MPNWCGRDNLIRILVEAGQAEICREGSLKAVFSAVQRHGKGCFSLTVSYFHRNFEPRWNNLKSLIIDLIEIPHVILKDEVSCW